MALVNDVARYVLDNSPRMTGVKLQKLVYYCQAWSLVWDDEPLFESRIEAWIHGPIVPDLWNCHEDMYWLDHWTLGDSTNLTDNERDTIKVVLDHYGTFSSQRLSDLTHEEDPWNEARRGLPINVRGSNEITTESLRAYYSAELAEYGAQTDSQEALPSLVRSRA